MALDAVEAPCAAATIEKKMTHQFSGEHLIIGPNTLVFYVDETGDEQLKDKQRPIFAFGGVASVQEHHIEVARSWQAMKAKTFPQVIGPLHAKTHMRERLSRPKREAVLAAMPAPPVARFGTIITSTTIVPLDRVVEVACGTLANRFVQIVEGLVTVSAWNAPGRVVAVFEQSTRLAGKIEQHFPGRLRVCGHDVPMEGCFMPKSMLNPFLEMADFVANTLGRNIEHQQKHGREHCTDNFQALFRDVAPPLANYIEITETIWPR